MSDQYNDAMYRLHKDRPIVEVPPTRRFRGPGRGRRKDAKTNSPDAQTRTCLKCGKEFLSTHNGNRLCGFCPTTDVFSSQYMD